MKQNVKVGDTIKITHMDDDNGKDKQAMDYNGRTGEVTLIDDAEQLHGTCGGLAVIPETDEFIILN